MFCFREVDKSDAEADAVLIKSDLAAQWKPFACGQLDLKVYCLAFSRGHGRVKETSAKAHIADARGLLAGESFPSRLKTKRDAFRFSSLFIHLC